MVGLFAGVLLPFFPDGLLVSSASADYSPIDLTHQCSAATGQCAPYPGPAPLLSPAALASATPSQADALRALEDTAVQAVLADHGLPASDADAVQSWGRPQAESELWLLIVQAIQKAPADRTAAQQQVVDWMAALDEAQQNQAAIHAGEEYTMWAGLNVGDYDQLATTGSEADLGAFLSQAVEPYNTADPATATGGYCKYKPPAPDSGDYDGSATPTCFTPCQSPVGCPVPTPTYDQFVSWGQAAATYSTLTSTDFMAEIMTIANGTSVIAALAGAGLTAVTLAVVVPSATLDAMAAALYPTMGGPELFVGAAAASSVATGIDAIAAIATVVAVVIFAIVTSVLEGIRVADDAKLPLQLAQLVVGARTVTADPAALLNDSAGLATLFYLFVGATMPAPRIDSNCDWESTVPNGQLSGTYNPLGAGPDTSALNRGCLNPPAIPAASPTDPHFLVTPQGGQATASPTISLDDQQHGYTSTVRLSDKWFVQHVVINGETSDAESLDLDYTDWSGAPQRATLLHTPSGYVFVGLSTPVGGDSSSADPSTCAASGTCWKSDTIQYLGADGHKYSATVQPPETSTGTPTYPTHILEGTQASFLPNGFQAADAVHSSDYTWRFQATGCGIIFTSCQSTQPGGGPDYSAPIHTSDAHQPVNFTWQAPGTALVQLTADDLQGHVATTTFPVTVEDVAPKVTLSPDCAQAGSPCDVRTLQSVSNTLTVTGAAVSAGTGDNENVVVHWGDGSTDTMGAGDETRDLLNPHLTVTQSGRQFGISGTHQYSDPGVYNGTVSVSDWGGGTDTASFTATVQGKQSISFPTLGDQVYGGTVTAAATGSPTGQPVIFSASPASVCTDSGSRGEIITMVGVGQCTVTASQPPAPPLFGTADPVAQTFTVKPVPLTITADDQTKAFGAADPTFTASFDGLVNGDTKADLTGLTVTGPPTDSSVGDRPIVASGVTDPNYVITYVKGTETITPAPLTITADDQSKTYGAADPTFTATYAGLAPWDTKATISGVTITGPPTGSGVGQYPITVSAGSNPNYTITTVNGKETIKAAPLTITAQDATKVYGAPNPAFTATYSGLVNGDTPSVVTGLTLTGPPATGGVGSYPIHPSGASSPNYAITYVDGHETVTPSMLVIKADAKTVASGNVATYTWAGVGWVNGDNDATLSHSPNHVPTCAAIVKGAAASRSTPPGVYANAITCQGAVDANYTITYAPASLTVDPVITLSQTGLPTTVAAKATLDGVSVTLPVTRREVGYNTAHSYSFPGAVVGPDGTIYTTAAAKFSGNVTANVNVTAAYATVNGLVDAAVKSGGMPKALGTALEAVWTKAQTDLKAGKTSAAKVDIAAFAALVVAGRLANKITPATATLLLQRAQTVFTSIGGQGSL